MRRFDKKNNIKKVNLIAERNYLKSKGLLNENDDVHYLSNELKSATSLEEIDSILKDTKISKGDLMKIAYDGNTRNVDSALPINIWDKLNEFGGNYYFVMDYQNNSHGKLVHLGEKILGMESNWEEKIFDNQMNETDISENESDLTDIAKFVQFAYNFPPKFIEEAFNSEGQNMVNHLEGKFNEFYNKVGASCVMLKFYTELDSENRKLLENYILSKS